MTDAQKTMTIEERVRMLDRSSRVHFLRQQAFDSIALSRWCFENDDGTNPQLAKARRYVRHWQEMKRDNRGLLLWGGVGTGKSFAAACIANELLEALIPVRMTSLPHLLGRLNAAHSAEREDILEGLNRCDLLILDDLGAERGSEYALEQVYTIIDGRYRSGLPLIVTTNLSLNQLKQADDPAHARIYDRVLELCVPLRFDGPSRRQALARENTRALRQLLAPEAEGDGL